MTYGGFDTKIEYFLTIDTAKELAMVERNEKGRQARRYFIECEKQLKNSARPTLTPDQVQQRQRALHTQYDRLMNQCKQHQAKIEYHQSETQRLRAEIERCARGFGELCRQSDELTVVQLNLVVPMHLLRGS